MKRFSAKLVLFSLIISLLISNLALASSALTYGPFDEVVWEGSGDVVVNIDLDHEAFVGLEYADYKFDSEGYTVDGADGKTVITLKEDFLKDINFNKGKHIFWARYHKENLQIFEHEIIIEEEIRIPNIAGVAETFLKLSINGEDIDSSNFSLDIEKKTIKFEEDFFKQLPENSKGIIYTSIDELNAQFALSIINEPEFKNEPYVGDLNGDGKISAADARLCLRAAAKIENLSQSQTYAADVFGDGKISAKNARLILRASAKLEDIEGRSFKTSGVSFLTLKPLKNAGSGKYNWECEVSSLNGSGNLVVLSDIISPLEEDTEPPLDGKPTETQFVFVTEGPGEYTVNLKLKSSSEDDVIDEISFKVFAYATGLEWD